MAQFAAAAKALRPVDSSAWAASTEAMHKDYLAYSSPVPNAGPVQLAEIIASIRDQVPSDTIVTNGAGNYTGWGHRFWRWREYATHLAPTSGSMGYSLPSPLSSAITLPPLHR